MTTETREIHLARRPSGAPVPDDFRLVTTTLPDLGEGEVLVRTDVMSVDPYMRGRMNDAKSYVPPFALDAPLEGAAVGEVLESRAEGIEVGDTVLHGLGWREHAVVSGKAVRRLDVSTLPASTYLGVLGSTGLTAYVGLTRIAEMKQGETVFVSGAAGAVGSSVGQMARLLGAGKVIGSAGSADKVSWLTDDLGFDAAFDYHDGRVSDRLGEHGPVDVYFDNVGGEHLEAAITHLNDFGRVAVCGMIAGYNDPSQATGPRNMMMVVQKRLRLQGFIVTDHYDLASEFYEKAGAWVADGSLKHRETFADGLDHAVEAFLGVLSGANTGKMLVRL